MYFIFSKLEEGMVYIELPTLYIFTRTDFTYYFIIQKMNTKLSFRRPYLNWHAIYPTGSQP